jgi:hypothetical protein
MLGKLRLYLMIRKYCLALFVWFLLSVEALLMDVRFLVRPARCVGLVAVLLLAVLVGCAKHQPKPTITAIGLSPGNRCEPAGIPYYLPKPLLVVAKNVRHVEESQVGLTGPAPIPNGFDNQASFADLKANVTVPRVSGSATGISAARVGPAELSKAKPGQPTDQAYVPAQLLPMGQDGLQPDSFYTYQIVFVPDLTQKYGLQISGGAGEFRAAMNMVNGWMYTGMGPFYLKDSSSAQNAMATGAGAMFAGRGVSDVIDSVGGLTETIGDITREESGIQNLDDLRALERAVAAIETATRTAPRVQQQILNYAEIYIYEPVLTSDQTTEWHLVAEHHFDRDYLEVVDSQEAAKARTEIFQRLLLGDRGGPANSTAEVATAGKSPSGAAARRSSSAKSSAKPAAKKPTTAKSTTKTTGSGTAPVSPGQGDDGVIEEAGEQADAFTRPLPPESLGTHTFPKDAFGESSLSSVISMSWGPSGGNSSEAGPEVASVDLRPGEPAQETYVPASALPASAKYVAPARAHILCPPPTEKPVQVSFRGPTLFESAVR